MSAAPPSGPAPAWRLWRNPILRRYLRTRLRPRGLGAALLMTMLVAGFIFAMSRTIGLRQIEMMERHAESQRQSAMMVEASKTENERSRRETRERPERGTQERPGRGRVMDAPQQPNFEALIPSMADIERYCLLPLLVLQGLILFIMGTGQVAGGMTADADEGTMDYMRLSPMTPLGKVLGYLFGLPVREWILFASTLPFTAWGLWRGEVPVENWLPVYAVVLTAAVLYHLTGLTAGTVLRNRRWAFLVSMGGVFLLYTVVPQLANLGLVYFEYLTIWPVLTENMHAFLPEAAGRTMRTAQSMMPDVGFFSLGFQFPEAAFTIFSQLVLILTFLVMLWRRWRRSESHLLGKAWATGLFAWVQIVLLGCSLPLISPGLLFITRRIGMRFNFRGWNMAGWSPDLTEAILMISIYGTVTLLALIMLGLLIAPGRDSQDRGLRRTAKLNRRRIPFFADESPAIPFVIVMAITGAAGWTIFADRVIGSHWFPGQVLPAWTPFLFGLVLLTTGLCCVLIYELRGAKGLFLATIFAGVVPLMAGAVMAAASNDLSTASVWITSASPILAPANAVTAVLPDALGDQHAIRLAAPRAFAFWQGLMLISAVWLLVKHRATRKTRDVVVDRMPAGDLAASAE
jgi:hypothetical protein